MSDYNINYTPERNTIRASGEGTRDEGEPMGMQIEGFTTFKFEPCDEDYSQEQFVDTVESILEREYFEFGQDINRPYYFVAYTRHDWSVYHLAVEKDKYIALFVRTVTTEQSVKEFHEILSQTTGHEWGVEKQATDLTGSGPNRSK
jgi:hypothetical protein